MNRLQKVLLFSVSGLLLLVLGLALFVHLYFTDERLRDIAEPALEAQLSREVSIGGFEIKLLRSLPNLSVAISDIAIHTPPRNGAPSPDLASVGRIWVDVPVLPLLKGVVHVNALELDDPQVLIEVYDDLSSNLIELGGVETDSSASEGASSDDLEIALEDIRIRNGDIGYIHADGTIMTIAGLGAELSARLAETALLQGQVHIEDTYFETGGITYADHWSLNLDIDAETHLDSAWLRIDKAELGVQDLLLQLAGSVDDYNTDRIGVNLSLEAPAAPVSSFWSLLPAALTKDVSGLESEGVFSVQALVDGVLSEGALPDFNAALIIKDGTIKYPDVPSSIRGLTLDAALTNTELTIEEFSAEADGARLSAKAVITDFTRPVVQADIDMEMNLASVDRYYPLDDSTSLSGEVTVDSRLQGLLENTDQLEVSGAVGFASVNYNSTLVEQPINDLNGQLVFDNDKLQLNDFSLTTGQSDLQVDGTLTGYSALFADSTTNAPDPYLQGIIKSNFLNLTEQISEDTSSSFVGPLELPPIQLDVGLNVKEMVFNGVKLSDATGTLTMKDGVVGFDDISAQLFGGALGASGNFDLSNTLSPVFNGAVSLNQIPVTEFFTSFSDMGAIVQIGNYLEGLFDTEASFGLSLDKDLNPRYESIIASGAFGARQGSFGTMPLQSVLANFTGVSALESLDVKDWSHAFSVSGEKFHVQDLSINAGEFAFSLNGSQSFDGSLDYQLSVELPESASNALAGAPIQGALGSITSVVNTALTNPSTGRITLDLSAAGTFADPVVGLNSDKMKARLTSTLAESIQSEAEARIDSLEQSARERAEAELEEQRRQLEERARGEVDQLVGGLVDSTIISSPIDSLKEQGADALKDRLKGLFDRKKKNN